MVEKNKITINLGKTLFDDLNTLAEITGCPGTSIARVALLEFLNKNKREVENPIE